VGGLHPDLPWSYFTDMMRGIKARAADIHVKAFTAVEVFFFQPPVPHERREGARGAARGSLDSMPGGGRRSSLPPRATDHPRQGGRRRVAWRDAHRAPASASPPTRPCSTRHIESVEDRVDHLLRLRAAGRDGRVRDLHARSPSSPGRRRRCACRRRPLRGPQGHRGGAAAAGQLPAHQVVLDHDRAAAGPGGASSFGADDIDGTVTEEKIAHDAGARPRAVHDVQRAGAVWCARRAAGPSSATPSSTGEGVVGGW